MPASLICRQTFMIQSKCIENWMSLTIVVNRALFDRCRLVLHHSYQVFLIPKTRNVASALCERPLRNREPFLTRWTRAASFYSTPPLRIVILRSPVAARLGNSDFLWTETRSHTAVHLWNPQLGNVRTNATCCRPRHCLCRLSISWDYAGHDKRHPESTFIVVAFGHTPTISVFLLSVGRDCT